MFLLRCTTLKTGQKLPFLHGFLGAVFDIRLALFCMVFDCPGVKKRRAIYNVIHRQKA